MSTPEKWDSMTRKQLMLTATEYRSERDAAKSDTLRAFDERNILQAENARLTSEVARLRVRFGCAYAGPALYRDDGECQDNRCHPAIDFKRDSIDEIDAKIIERLAAALAKP